MATARRRVYVSSTFVDLERHRSAVKGALERAGYEVESMERYPAFDERPLDKCLADVAASDAYVLILAHRYGHVEKEPGEAPRSITEREYDAAVAAGKPRFVFVVEPDHPWSPKWVDSPKSAAGRRLVALRKRAGATHGVRSFTDPASLATEVIAALSSHGWGVKDPMGGTAKGYAWPKPWDFGAYMADKREVFEGRDWLFAKVAAWQAQPHTRALLIEADYGVGKSAIMAEFVARNPGGSIVAWHFCQHDTEETLRPGAFVRSLAAQLAATLPDYKAAVDSDPALQERLDRALADPGSALDGAVLAPLWQLAAPPEPRVIVIDALDEALELDAEVARRGTLVTLLASKAGRFPRWLRLLVTARPVPAVRDPLGAFGVERIDAERSDNQDDLRRYILGRAAREPLAERLREAKTGREAFAALLLGRSQGKFLYAVRAMHDVEIGRVSVGDLEALAPGMDSFYLDGFQRRFTYPGRDYEAARATLGGSARHASRSRRPCWKRYSVSMSVASRRCTRRCPTSCASVPGC